MLLWSCQRAKEYVELRNETMRKTKESVVEGGLALKISLYICELKFTFCFVLFFLAKLISTLLLYL